MSEVLPKKVQLGFSGGDRLPTLDVVFANPLYSIKQWSRSAWEK